MCQPLRIYETILILKKVSNVIFIVLLKKSMHSLTLFFIIAPFDAFEISYLFENIMENGAFAQKEQMLHFP